MKRAVLFACLLALTAPAFAQPLGDTEGPITNQGERNAIASRVRTGQGCAGCDLFQIDLAYQNVAGRNFSGARMRQSDLTVATADRANFSGANMSMANLFGARLTGADLSNVNLNGAILVGGYFGGAHFNGAAMAGANLSGAELASAHGLTQAQLDAACGDGATTLPAGLTIPAC